MRYVVRDTIKDTGFPVHTKSGAISKKWQKAHPAANREALKEFGSTKAKAVAKLERRIPDHELLGKHTRAGKIIISGKVPKSLRAAIAYHEKIEHEIMAGRR